MKNDNSNIINDSFATRYLFIFKKRESRATIKKTNNYDENNFNLIIFNFIYLKIPHA